MRTFQQQLDTIDRRQVAGGIITLFGFFILLRHNVGAAVEIQRVMHIPTWYTAGSIFMGGFLLMVKNWPMPVKYFLWFPVLVIPSFTLYRVLNGEIISLGDLFAEGFLAFATYFLLFILRRPRVGNT